MKMADENNVVRLAVVNDSVKVDGDAARELVVQFLREWADAIETGKENVSRAVLIMHDDAGSENFRIRTRRCNVDLIAQVGMMQLALNDVCRITAEDDG